MTPRHYLAIAAVMLACCLECSAEAQQERDAGAPDVPVLNTEAQAGLVSVKWMAIPCQTCYVPCGFGPKGCLRPVMCCGDHIHDMEDFRFRKMPEMRDP